MTPRWDGAMIETKACNSNRPKVGIITLPGNFNYGNRLQAYATVAIFEKAGCAAEQIELERKTPAIPRAVQFVRSMKYRILGIPILPRQEDMSTPERLAAFARFNMNYPIRRLAELPENFAGQYDYFCVGSDQVWNPNLFAGRDDWYFLRFACDGQRMALSASFGIDCFDSEQQKASVREGLKGFERISVREKQGAELVRECSGLEATVLVDPTLTVSSEEWRSVADGRLTPDSPFVFAYLLGGVGAEAGAVLADVTRNGEVPIVPLTDCQKPNEPDAGPAEFIDLIDHAQHVVTDSFHASVFAMLLETPLTITHREGGGASMFSRLDQLADTFGLRDKIFGSEGFDLARAGDYPLVREALDRERERVMAYLEGCLNG